MNDYIQKVEIFLNKETTKTFEIGKMILTGKLDPSKANVKYVTGIHNYSDDSGYTSITIDVDQKRYASFVNLPFVIYYK